MAFCPQHSSDHRRPRDCLMSPCLGPAALLDWIIPVLSCGVFSSSSGLLPNRYQELSSRNIANVLCGAALPPHLAGAATVGGTERALLLRSLAPNADRLGWPLGTMVYPWRHLVHADPST